MTTTDPIRARLDNWDHIYFLHGTPAYPPTPNSMQGNWGLMVDALRAVLDLMDKATDPVVRNFTRQVIADALGVELE